MDLLKNRFLNFGYRAVLVFLVCWVCIGQGIAAEHAGNVEKTGNMAVIYAITSVLALLLLVGCMRFLKNNRGWFLTLFASVFVVNLGYLLLAVSGSLRMAMASNTVSYLGSVFLPLSLLMIILQVCNLRVNRVLMTALCLVSVLTFLLAASGDTFGLYYKSVTVEYIGSVATLQKEYGPLHVWYMFYLLLYFCMMVGAIAVASIRKTIASHRHAVFLASIVLGNICVWYIEQLVQWNFEFLSVMYIISELLLLLIDDILREYDTLKQAANHGAATTTARFEESPAAVPAELCAVSPERIAQILSDCPTVQLLTTREKEVLTYLLRDVPRKEIAETLFVTENTVKKHTSNIFFKLEVSNRRELLTKLDQNTPGSIEPTVPECM